MEGSWHTSHQLLQTFCAFSNVSTTPTRRKMSAVISRGSSTHGGDGGGGGVADDGAAAFWGGLYRFCFYGVAVYHCN
ncbi:hypothetical protein KY290_014256 [Solanum tuberosum]|uniref:Uncharacterized protein n=1 Tax=Solanum tuberosum TaxID=4113 RepID=A0ABQ7VP47_SOLTU|nr:hypothetical protein KY289_014318 [Solanum tuberosum]KAH0699439.1 hypothetical protein KY284_013654 [Solanum tuberosum]KAH0770275.1 hypothetical protein KY290_014256 [Solanum tuberosum]